MMSRVLVLLVLTAVASVSGKIDGEILPKLKEELRQELNFPPLFKPNPTLAGLSAWLKANHLDKQSEKCECYLSNYTAAIQKNFGDYTVSDITYSRLSHNAFSFHLPLL